MADTATIPLWDALGAAIDAGADPPLDGLGRLILDPAWPRFYRGRVTADPVTGKLPEPDPVTGQMPGYFLLGLVDLVPGGSYNGETGEAGTATIHCWAATPDDAERLYRWLRGLLHDEPLVVAGFGTVTGQVSKSGPTSDAAGTAYQVTARYAVEPEDG